MPLRKGGTIRGSIRNGEQNSLTLYRPDTGSAVSADSSIVDGAEIPPKEMASFSRESSLVTT